MEEVPSFDIDFEVPAPIIPERQYQNEAERLIAQTFTEEAAAERMIDHARRSQEAERGILTTLNQKLGRLGRVGLLAGALTGLSGMQEVQAPAPSAAEVDKFSVMTGRSLDPAEGTAQALIRKQVGSRPLFALEQGPTLEPGYERRTVPLLHFESRPKSKKITEAMLASLPPSFLSNIERFEYEDEMVGMGSEYGLEGSVEVAHANSSTYEIVLTKGSNLYESFPFVAADVIAHEACHLNGPDTHRGLTAEARYQLYQTLLQRVQAPDRFHSSYVERINNPDAQVQLYRKASEYWAETCGAYISGVADLPTADRVMVQSLIHQTDPAFSERARENAGLARGKVLLKLSEAEKAKPKS